MSRYNPAAWFPLFAEPIQELPSHPSGMVNAKSLTFMWNCIK